MSDDEPRASRATREEALPLSTLREIDAICDRFQKAWCTGKSPRLEDYLVADLPPNQLRALFANLLDVELNLRRTAGQAPANDEYRQRFAAYLTQIDDVFASAEKTVDEETAEQSQDQRCAASRQIGPYKLLQKIAEGGMGTVWMAEQEQPVRRRVALKLIRSGREDKQILARFESERQALAMMDHPNVARILDAGAADDGTPYFVMELVQGEPITAYCDQHKLSLAERLELFIPVCEAVQHAHQKGIVHRDLKPSNILVHIHAGQPQAKVIDFGLAKALQHQTKLTDKTVFTEFGQVVGTVQYMSPEQARLDAVDVDTRTDIYSLGVILYELLSGSTPIEQGTLEAHALLEVLEIIREREPPRPSHRLSSSIDRLDAISQRRRIAPSRLQQILRGELDWIVMRAIEKDRSRRYDSAAALADDVFRYLNQEPVKARPPSTLYLLKTLNKKHRGKVWSFLAFTVSLVMGLVSISVLYHRATAEAMRAQRAERIAWEVNELLANILESADPGQSLGKELTVRDALDAASAKLEHTPLTPEVEAQLRVTIGNTYQNLGYLPEARMHLTRAVDLERAQGDVDPGRFSSVLVQLAGCEYDFGDYEAALQHAARAIEFMELHGILTVERMLAYRTLGDGHAALGRTTQSEEYLNKAIEFGDKISGAEAKLEEAAVHNSLGVLHQGLERKEAAVAHYRQSLVIRTSQLTERHPLVATTMTNLASLLLTDNARSEEAIELMKQAYEIRKEILPNNHPDIGNSLHNLAAAEYMVGDIEAADRNFSLAVEARKNALPVNREGYLKSVKNAALIKVQRGKPAEALEYVTMAADVLFDVPNQLQHIKSILAVLDLLEKEGKGDTAIDADAARLRLRLLEVERNIDQPSTNYD